MVKRPHINVGKATDNILCFLHHQFATSNNISFLDDELVSAIPEASINTTRLALDELTASNFVEATYFPDGFDDRPSYHISRQGIELVQSWPDVEYEKAAEGVTFSEKHMEDKAAPASDRSVTLTDNQRIEATQTLEEIVKEFQKDHHFNNEWVAEKNALLKALENGKNYLDAKILDTRIGTMMIIEPLQAIADKYKEAAINGSFSALAQKALEFFINLFAG